MVQAMVGGLDVSTYQDADKRYDVRIRLEEDDRDRVDKLNLLQVKTGDGDLVDLVSVVDFELSEGPLQIEQIR